MEWLQNETSYCAGTIVGDVEYLRDLFINIYRWSMTTSNPTPTFRPNAAYNVLINLYPFKDCVQKVTQEEGFVTQLGTVLVKKDEFKDVLLEPTPIVDENYIVKNQKGEVFPLVHQYDRIHNLNNLYMRSILSLFLILLFACEVEPYEPACVQ